MDTDNEQADAPEESGENLYFDGRNIACPICGHNRFTERTALLNTRASTFFNLDWANPEAQNYVCTRCGYILWFLPR